MVLLSMVFFVQINTELVLLDNVGSKLLQIGIEYFTARPDTGWLPDPKKCIFLDKPDIQPAALLPQAGHQIPP